MYVEQATPDLYADPHDRLGIYSTNKLQQDQRPNQPESRAQTKIGRQTITSTHGRTSMEESNNEHHSPFYTVSDRSLLDLPVHGHESPTGVSYHALPLGHGRQLSAAPGSHSFLLQTMTPSSSAPTGSSISAQSEGPVDLAAPSKPLIRSSTDIGRSLHARCQQEIRTNSENVLEHRMEGEKRWRMRPRYPHPYMILIKQQIEL